MAGVDGLVVTAISDEELEEGELSSSEDEEDKLKDEGEKKPQASESKPNNEDTVSRKRPSSPYEDQETNDEKRSKVTVTEEECKLEDGEIFSDDEEAAYYPQLVKSRKKVEKVRKRSPSSSPPRSLSPSPKKYSDDSSRSSYSDRDKSRYSRKDKHDHLEVNHSHSRYSKGRSPHRSPRNNRRDTQSRDRFSSGRSRSTNTQDLIGQPIRHDRAPRKWESNQPQTVRGGQILTLKMIENRLKQGLSVLLTPHTKPILSLDEYNYPAAPQWYLKAVAAYNRRHNQQRTQPKEITSPTSSSSSSFSEKIDAPQILTNSGKMPETSASLPIQEPVRPALVEGRDTIQASVGVGASGIPDAHQQSSSDLPLPLPPSAFHNLPLPLPTSLPVPLIPPSSIQPLFPPQSTSEAKVPANKPLSPSGDQLNVSIPLSQVSISSASDPVQTELVSPTDNEDFNYDDYLDQLNDEEEDDKPKKATEDIASDTLQAGFWIDPVPTSGSGNNGKDPLEDDFPSIEADKTVSSEGKVNDSLRALISQESIDDTIASEEGKDVRQSAKKSANKSARRKQKDKQWLAKQRDFDADKRKQQQHYHQPQPEPKPRQICKYYQNGFCVHGDKCQYSHDIARERKREVCKFYLQDGCSKGDACLFLHGDFPCKFFHTGAVCFHGDKCKFSHAPLTRDGYDILMTIVDPNLRDKVHFPDAVPGGHHQGHTPQPLPPPDLMPPHGGTRYHDPQGIPAPPGGGVRPNHHPPPPHPHPPSSHMWSNAPPMSGPEQPVAFNPPAPHPPPPPHPMAHHSRPPQPQPWINTTDPAPYHSQPPQTQPQPNSMGMWQDPQHHQAQSLFRTPQGAPKLTNEPKQGPQLSSNVPLPPNFDIKTLFPDTHPQILPHDLATKLRKSLLPTPSSTDTEEPKMDIEYWENPEQPAPPVPTTSPPISPHMTTVQNQMAPPPTYPSPPPPPATNFQPPQFHQPFKQPPLPPHRNVLPPGHMVQQQQNMSAPPHASVTQSRHDPRFSRQRPPPPQPGYSSAPPPMQQQPMHHHQPQHHLQHRPSPPGPPQPRNFNHPPHPLPDRGGDAVAWGVEGRGRDDLSRDNASSPPQHSQPEQPKPKRADPRLKYSHLKIKSRSQAGSEVPSGTAKPQPPGIIKPLPGLLKDRSKLTRPLEPHELFGNAQGKEEAEQQEGVSFFGSFPKYYSKTGSPTVPSSPLPDKQKFGELKMKPDGVSTTPDTEKVEEENQPCDREETESSFVPSYLTHLNLDLQTDEDNSELKIDSAFGSLTERKRRLSEIGSSFSEDSRDEGVSSPRADGDHTTLFRSTHY